VHKLIPVFLPALTIFLLLLITTGCDKGEVHSISSEYKSLKEEIKKTPGDDAVYPKLLDSLINMANRSDRPEEQVEALSLAGEYHYVTGDYKSALNSYKKLVAIAEEHGLSLQLGKGLDNQGKTYFRLKDRNNAIASFKKAASVCEVTGDSTGVGSALNNVGFMYWQESNFDSAIIFFNKALDVRSKLSNNDHHASTLNNLGTIYFNWAIYDKALEYYMKSLALQKEINNNYGITISLSNIGQVYDQTSQHEEAIQYYRESLPYAIASKDTQVVGYAYQGLGYAFEPINIDSSIYYLKLSLETYKKAKYVPGEILSLKGIGNFYLKQKNYEVAEGHFTQMYQLAQKEKIMLREAEALKGLGEVRLAQNDIVAAEQYLSSGIKDAESINNKVLLRDIFKLLSEIYERSGKTDSAYFYIKKHILFAQQIQDEEMSRKLIGLKNKFQFQKYETDLQRKTFENETQRLIISGVVVLLILLVVTAWLLLRMNKKKEHTNMELQKNKEMIERQSNELSAKNKELIELNEARDKLSSIIAHDLRSPFQSFLGLSEVLREDYYELTDSQKIQYITMLNETARKSFDLLENLLYISASRIGKLDFNPSEVSVWEVASKIVKLFEIQASEKKVRLINNIPGSAVAFADRIMLEIVIRNLVNNALKYTDENGRIELNSRLDENRVFIEVKDNGIGMDEETRANIFNANVIKSQKGTRGEKGTGLGLGLCKEFAEKNGGSIRVESESGIGSRFILELPVKSGE